MYLLCTKPGTPGTVPCGYIYSWPAQLRCAQTVLWNILNRQVSLYPILLLQNSESVSLDLLTYADLESLRNRKAGLGTRAIPGGQRSALNTKRYLIVTYTVEFDR